MTEKSRTVGLILLTDHPRKGRVAVLQRRGSYNPETDEDVTWKYGCQATSHGIIPASVHTPVDALLGHVQAQLGYVLLQHVSLHLEDLICLMENEETPREIVTTYGMLLPNWKIFNRGIKLHPGTGGLEWINESRLAIVAALTHKNKNKGAGRCNIAMFPDEKEALTKAFQIFAGLAVTQ